MSQAHSSWSIRDVPSQIRELAQEAANREGIPVGDWLVHRIATRAMPGERTSDTEARCRTDDSRCRTADLRATQSPVSHLSDESMKDAVAALARLLESNKSAQDYASRAIQNVATQMDAVTRDQAAVLQSLDERVEGVEGKADSIAQHNREIASRLDALSTDLQTLAKTIVTTREASDRAGLFVQEQLNVFGQRVRSSEVRSGNYSKLEETVAKLEASQSATANKLDDLAGDFLNLLNTIRSFG